MSSTGFMTITLSAASCRKHYGAITNELQKRLFTEERTSITEEVFSSVVENFMAEVGKKVSVEPKAKKVKEPKGPGVREQARQAALKQLAELDSEKAVELAEAKTAEIKKAIKVINKANAPPKVKKAAAKTQFPKSDYTHRPLKVNKEFIMGNNGAKLRVAIHKETRKVHRLVEDNWSDEATCYLSTVFTEKDGELYDLPKAKKTKATKVAKKPVVKKAKKVEKSQVVEEKTENPTKSQKDLIASLVSEAASDVMTTPVEESGAKDDKEAPTIESVTKAVSKITVADEQVEEEMEEIQDSDDDMVSSDDEDEEEVEFNADDVEEFEHSSRQGEKLYIDSEFRVWDDEQDMVGTYNAATDTIF